jgi:diguanylate cyclase (GGDEF)-like protein
MMPDLMQTDDVHIVFKKIQEVFESPFMLDGVAVYSATSIGVSIFPDDGESSEVIMKKADKAMYEMKESGRNSFRFYNADRSE